MRAGDRVEVRAEQEATCSHEARDEVRVSFVLASEEFAWDTIYVSRLVSRAEAESLGFEVGASVWHEEPDFGFSGWADIAAVEPVHIEAGAGCAVVATVVHQNGDILRLAFSDGTEVTGTGRHRFWSETRRDWVAARELREGETLRTPSGVVRLESATPSRTLTAVYNLEVEGAHEYFVGEGEVLVHNGGGLRFGCTGGDEFWDQHSDELGESEVERMRRAPDAHTLERHGGSVTDEQLMTRARTGVAPDGSVRLSSSGDVVVPPHATAFHSDSHMLLADRHLRESGAVSSAFAKLGPSAAYAPVPRTHVGVDVGRGFSRVGGATSQTTCYRPI